MATKRQLIERGITDGLQPAPPRPWLRIQGTDDATTMWYAVMRKQVRDVFIGTLALRHSDHHASLMEQGWEEIEVEELRGQGVPRGPSRPSV